jgi:hypothetical protein
MNVAIVYKRANAKEIINGISGKEMLFQIY